MKTVNEVFFLSAIIPPFIFLFLVFTSLPAERCSLFDNSFVAQLPYNINLLFHIMALKIIDHYRCTERGFNFTAYIDESVDWERQKVWLKIWDLIWSVVTIKGGSWPSSSRQEAITHELIKSDGELLIVFLLSTTRESK